jgi:hypothetical protein
MILQIPLDLIECSKTLVSRLKLDICRIQILRTSRSLELWLFNWYTNWNWAWVTFRRYIEQSPGGDRTARLGVLHQLLISKEALRVALLCMCFDERRNPRLIAAHGFVFIKRFISLFWKFLYWGLRVINPQRMLFPKIREVLPPAHPLNSWNAILWGFRYLWHPLIKQEPIWFVATFWEPHSLRKLSPEDSATVTLTSAAGASAIRRRWALVFLLIHLEDACLTASAIILVSDLPSSHLSSMVLRHALCMLAITALALGIAGMYYCALCLV